MHFSILRQTIPVCDVVNLRKTDPGNIQHGFSTPGNPEQSLDFIRTRFRCLKSLQGKGIEDVVIVFVFLRTCWHGREQSGASIALLSAVPRFEIRGSLPKRAARALLTLVML